MENDLAKQLGWDRLPETTQQELTEELGEVVISAIERRCKPLLNRKQRKEYEKLMQIDAVRAWDFLKQCTPDFSLIAQEETTRVCRETVDTQAAVMNKLGVS